MNDALLTTAGLSKSFGGVNAVDNVNLRVDPQEIHAIIGPNGAGKTTLLSLLSGILKPDQGTIHFRQNNITHLNLPQRAKLGLGRSFQITSVILQMTLIENVMLSVKGRQPHAYQFWYPAEKEVTIRTKAKEILEQVGLSGRMHQSAATVSHGEQRQLELAMVLAMEPSLLLLDEPMAGMGQVESEIMLTLLKQIGTQQTILLIEHDMDTVFSLARTVSVLDQGQIIASDSAEKIRSNKQVQSAYLGEATD